MEALLPRELSLYHPITTGGIGLRKQFRSGRAMRLELRYYRGMVIFPLTVGVTL